MASRKQTRRLLGGARVWLALCCCGFALTLQIGSSVCVWARDDLEITASFIQEPSVTPDTPIELRLSRALSAGEGRLAIVIANADLTSLFITNEARLVYSPTLVPLPLGESPLVVYLVGPDRTWRELARFVLQVAKERPIPVSTPESTIPAGVAQPEAKSGATGAAPTPAATEGTPADVATPTNAPTHPRSIFGFDKMSFVPSVTIAVESQVAQFNFPLATRPAERATFTDITLQSSLRSAAVRGPFASETQFDVAGSSFQQATLRFGSLGTRAPNIDLAGYLAQFRIGRVKVAVGQTSFGSARQLINSFSSRGVTIAVPIAKRFDLSAAAMNGTSVVGYGNFLGLSTRKHELASAIFGVELFPKRPGGLRLEFGLLTASLQPLNGVSQSSINDVERSKGRSVRLLFSDKGQRFKFDGGFTRSRYGNPADPLNSQNSLTRFGTATFIRNANYFDVSYEVLRSFAATKTKRANLNVTVRHEQVAPLYKSLGAPTQADKRQDEFLLSGSVGEITVQGGHMRFNDNLLRIPSILQALARATSTSVALPAAALFGGTSNTSPLLPRLSYSFNRQHQFGASIPVNGGSQIDPGSIPNQFLTNQTFSAEWQIKTLIVAYNYNRSFTNNEQQGHEHSDLLQQTNVARVGLSPLTTLKLNFDLSRDSTNDLGNTRQFRTWHAGPTATWDLNKRMTWTAGFANTIVGDRARTSGSRNTELDTEFTYRSTFERSGLKKVQTQMSVRYADRYARNHDVLFSITNLTRVRIVTAKLSITLF
jgi:hypothetical protein